MPYAETYNAIHGVNRSINSNVHPFSYRPPPVKKKKSRFFRRYIRPIGKGIRYTKRNPRKVALAALYVYQLVDSLFRDGPNSPRFIDLVAKGFTGKYKKESLEMEYIIPKLPQAVVQNPHFQRYLAKDRARRARLVNAMGDPLELNEFADTGVGMLAPKRVMIDPSYVSDRPMKRQRYDYEGDIVMLDDISL